MRTAAASVRSGTYHRVLTLEDKLYTYGEYCSAATFEVCMQRTHLTLPCARACMCERAR